MKIVHIAPNAPYNEGWGYQENLLPKYQVKNGHEVSLIVTNQMHKDGKIVLTECIDHISEDGVRVIRLPYIQYPYNILTGIHSRLKMENILDELKPDFIFFHGLISYTILDAIKYKRKHPLCVIVQDNHLDYNIGRRRDTLKEKLLCAWYRQLNHRSIPYVDRVYGVTPWRKTFAEDYFKIPPDKTDVLIMGADDEKLNFAQRDTIRKEIRSLYGVQDSDFLVITGGKIDAKKHIDILMEACGRDADTKLLVFGNVAEELETRFNQLLKQYPNLIYIGWIPADTVYNYFFAADLVVFPGQHSVLWEQACASKVPCVFQRWEGMEHVNNGGNSDFLDQITVEEIMKKLKELRFTQKYYEMQKVCQSEKTNIYLYSEIAKKSLECAKN